MNRHICHHGHSCRCPAALLLLTRFLLGLHSSLLNTGCLWGSVLTPLRLSLSSVGLHRLPYSQRLLVFWTFIQKYPAVTSKSLYPKPDSLISPLNMLLLLYALSQAETAPVTQDGNSQLLPIQQSYHHINCSLLLHMLQ